MREHAYLAAMMRVVGNHVGQHGCACGPRSCPAIAVKSFNPALRLAQSVCKHLATARTAFRQSGPGLLLRTASAVERRRELYMWRRKPQPFAADVVDVRDDARDRPSFTSRQLGAPCGGIEML